MCSSSVLTVSLCLLLCVPLCLSSEDPQEVKVKPGENATLQCRSSGEAEVVLIRWIRPDLKTEEFVFHYKDGRFQKESQHPSYLGRVELKDPEMKDGDVSVILKNVTFSDTGTYECVVGHKGNRPELISSIYLRVQHSVNITAAPGQTVSLPCRAPSNTDVIVVEWTRPELEPEYVFLYRDGRSVPENQLPSFKNRVELKDRDMKDGDVSMILKNVTSSDTGTYECHVFHTETDSSSRSEPISTIHLEVQSENVEDSQSRVHIELFIEQLGLNQLILIHQLILILQLILIHQLILLHQLILINQLFMILQLILIQQLMLQRDQVQTRMKEENQDPDFTDQDYYKVVVKEENQDPDFDDQDPYKVVVKEEDQDLDDYDQDCYKTGMKEENQDLDFTDQDQDMIKIKEENQDLDFMDQDQVRVKEENQDPCFIDQDHHLTMMEENQDQDFINQNHHTTVMEENQSLDFINQDQDQDQDQSSRCVGPTGLQFWTWCQTWTSGLRPQDLDL
ncbi:hypothetical protein INR49_007356, partial [Caranx melampygus]